MAAMLEKRATTRLAPEWLEPEFGIRDAVLPDREPGPGHPDLRLHKLTGLEHEKILEEYQSLLDLIAELLHILASPERLMEVIRDELLAVREAVRRRASHRDQHVQRRDQHRRSDHPGRRGRYLVSPGLCESISRSPTTGPTPRWSWQVGHPDQEEDFVERLLVANTTTPFCASPPVARSTGSKVYQLPEASRGARGRPIINLLPLDEGERITAILPVKEYDANKYVFFATANGTVKKTSLSDFSRPLLRYPCHQPQRG